MIKIKKISYVLVALSAIVLSSCGNSTANDSNYISVDETFEYGGTPSTEAERTSYNFVNDSQSTYKIVIPQNATSYEICAANEINTMLLKAYDCILTVERDETITYSPDSEYILLGNNKFLSELNISIPTQLGRQGFLIKNVDKSLVICGGGSDGLGTLNGAYEFLNKQCGYVCYGEDEIYVDKATNANLVSLDVLDKPDLNNYIGGSGVYSENVSLRQRMRIMDYTNVLGLGKITPYHNSFIYLPKASYQKLHPTWYSDFETQICYTAHGNKNEYDLMVQTVFERMLQEVTTYNLNIVTFTMEDESRCCNCDACKAAKIKYGADSGAVVEFCNNLSNKFKEYYTEQKIEKELNILFFAYYCFTEAPNPNVIQCNDNVYPLIAPITEMDRAVSIYHTKNVGIYNTMNQWKKLSQRCGLWVYSANFGNYLVPYDPFTCMQENYQFFTTLNTMYIFDQGMAKLGNANSTNFNLFKCWLNSQLAWDSNANVDTLTKAYFSNYFKDAYSSMYKYYTEYRVHLKYLNEIYDYSHNNNDCLNQKYFKFGTVMSWKNIIDDAFESIEHLKNTNVDLYKTLYKRITIESVAVNYLIIKLYGSYYSATTLEAMKAKFFSDCEIANINNYSEYGSINIAFN